MQDHVLNGLKSEGCVMVASPNGGGRVGAY